MSSGRDQCAYWCLQLSLLGFPNPGVKVSECFCLCFLCTSAQNCCCYAAIKLFSFKGGVNQAKLHMVGPALINLWSVAFWSLGMCCKLCLQYRMMTFVENTLSGSLRVCKNVACLSSVISTGPVHNAKHFSFYFFEIFNILIWEVSS